MKTFISMLRGINVSGQKMIKMAELKSVLEELPVKNVRTYIQSGNIIFDSSSSKPDQLSKIISDKILDHWKFEVPVITIEKSEFKNAFDQNPFLKRKDCPTDRLYITFLSDEPKSEFIAKIDSSQFLPDEFIVIDKQIYLYVPVSYGNSKLNNNFFESKLKVKATTRNLKTVLELIRMSEE